MRKLMITTLAVSMGLATVAMAQSSQTPGQMQTGPSTSTDNNTGMSGGQNSGAMPQLPQTQGDGSNATAAPGTSSPDTSSSSSMSTGNSAMPQAPMSGQKYPRCSKTVHDECRSGR